MEHSGQMQCEYIHTKFMKTDWVQIWIYLAISNDHVGVTPAQIENIKPKQGFCPTLYCKSLSALRFALMSWNYHR